HDQIDIGQVFFSCPAAPPALGSFPTRRSSDLDSTTSTSYTDTGLTNGQSYTYTVTAFNTVGESTPSASIVGQPVEPPTAPDPPTDLKSTHLDSRLIKSSHAVPDANKNNVYRDN